ncbi:beta-lactamase family protein [Rhizobiaceae bacterium BDR2-2]|uniref:Beta-lactamase family protein n=1 Tax=Ectorhizobium quercum TaxID=2965071 RepID=A0AAE3SU69_9HYPH|nr:serine hydrolase [Ectorhizobium quercum]MCX8996920.1 beta-lactamase family protein [Ectorhizobium quercum]
MTDRFSETYGFSRSDVTLASWRTTPYSRFAFQHVCELVPSAPIAAKREETEVAVPSDAFLASPVGVEGEAEPTVRAYLEATHTDSFVVMRQGRIVAEYYAPWSGPNAAHVVFSISKSLTAVLLGILEGQGLFDPSRPVTDYIPEAAGSAYGDCSCRDVLDMRVALDFEEAYLDPDGSFARYRRAMLWNPPEPGATVEPLLDFLCSLKKKAGEEHGGPFYYVSPNADLLGVLAERASGERYARLMSELLWKPLGAKTHASVTVDSAGTARSAGGVSVSARDLARVGELIRTGGAAGDRQIVPPAWIEDMFSNGDPEAWKPNGDVLITRGRYRSQWYQFGEPEGAFCAIGIHGQWLYVDRPSGTVVVKQSSQPNPLDEDLKARNLAFYRAVSARSF